MLLKKVYSSQFPRGGVMPLHGRQRWGTKKSTVVGQGAGEREEPQARAFIVVSVSLGRDRQGRSGIG